MPSTLFLLIWLSAAAITASTTASTGTSCSPLSATDASCHATREDEGDSPSLLQHPGQLNTLSLAVSKGLPVEIGENAVVVDGVSYSRKGAEGAFLGGIASLTVRGLPPTGKFVRLPPEEWLELNVLHPTTVNVRRKQSRAFRASHPITVHGANASGGAGAAAGERPKYALQKLSFASDWLILDWMSRPEQAAWAARFRALANPRVVTEVWLLARRGEPEVGSGCAARALSLSYLAHGGHISGPTCGRGIWTFSDSTVVAYRASAVSWSEDGTAVKLSVDIATR